MKLSSLLVEARDDYIIKTYGLKMFDAMKRDLTFLHDLSMSHEDFTDKEIYDVTHSSVSRETKERFIRALVSIIGNSDPASGKYTAWMSLQYSRGEIRIEDLPRVSDSLRIFDMKKTVLPQNERDINKYTYHTLVDKIEQLKGVDSTSRRKQKQDIKLNGAKKIYDGADCTVVHLLTKEAAIYYGKNTQWCTASTEQENHFDNYNRQGNLYVLIPKTDELLEKWGKIQIQFETEQINDDRDRPLSPDEIKNLSNTFAGYRYLLEKAKQPILERVDKKLRSLVKSPKDSAESSWPRSAFQYNIDDELRKPYRFLTTFMSGGRWLEYEQLLIKYKSNIIGTYARDILKHSWDVADEILLDNKNLPHILNYLPVKKGRWKEAEPVILTDTQKSMEYYNSHFINDSVKFDNLKHPRWSGFEHKLLTDLKPTKLHDDKYISNRNGLFGSNFSKACEYVNQYTSYAMTDERWPAFEDLMLDALLKEVNYLITTDPIHPSTNIESIFKVLFAFPKRHLTSFDIQTCYYNHVRFEDAPGWPEYEVLLDRAGALSMKAAEILNNSPPVKPGYLDHKSPTYRKLDYIICFEYLYFPYQEASARNEIRIDTRFHSILNNGRSARRQFIGSWEGVPRKYDPYGLHRYYT